MHRSSLLFLSLLALVPALYAQSQTNGKQPGTVQIASVDPSTNTELLLDAPDPASSLATAEEQSAPAPNPGNNHKAVASKYAGIILPGQTAVRLSAGEKAVYSMHDAFNPFAFIGVTISAGYSQAVDSAPHYGRDAEAFGKREGVSALRNTVQTLSTDALFSPIFHDDPRYYELGQGHSFLSRAWYAATRVVVVRSDSGHRRLNAPLLLGYGVAAGLNNAYYPDQDTGGAETAKAYASSLGGAVLSFEANEFLDDTLRAFHLRR